MVVIGASAGGVRALLHLLPGLSADFPAPVLVVLHIGAHRSHLAELLDTRGPNRAVVAQNGVVPEPGTIYIAPPDTHLLLENGALRLFRGPKEHHARPAINPLFRSAALELGPRVIGVVLTGMLDDGAAGLHAIKTCGGTTVVQDPADAAEPSMPNSALAATTPDHVLKLDAMANLLNNLVKSVDGADVPAPSWLQVEHAVSLGEGMHALATIGSPSGFTCPDCGGSLFELQDGQPVRFLCHTGHAFGLLSLIAAQSMVTDVALWAALRVVQEKEAILRRLAEVRELDAPGVQQSALVEADSLAAFARQLRKVVISVPPEDGLQALDEATEE